MTIQIPFRGIIEIVGEHDTGKTIAMLQTTNNPKDIVFIDDDVKGEGTVRQMVEKGMEFDDYINLATYRAKLGQAPTADELLQYVVMPVIEKIVSKKRKIIVWDTWRIVYQSARGHVERNQSKYSNVVTFRGTSQIIQGLISKVARMIEVKVLNELKANCELLLISHHIKEKYVNNVAIGKMPESSTTFDEVCNMRLWLRRNYRSKVPVILFLKRPNLPKMVAGKLRFVNIVPLKITPTDKHESIWDAIAEYERNPIESRMPTAEETPTPEELASISGELSPEQSAYLVAMIEYQKTLENDLAELEDINVSSKNVPDNYPSSGPEMISKAKSELQIDKQQVEEILDMPFKQIIKEYKSEYWDTLLKHHEGVISEKIGGKDGKSKAATKKKR